MIYAGHLVIPANRLKAVPLTTQIDVVEGVVQRVWVRWHWGPGNLCGVRIYRGGFQLWPTSLGEWFGSSIAETVFEGAYELTAEPLHFVIEGYNEDDTYDHEVWLGFEVLRKSTDSRLADLVSAL